jgi:hypothetical protein
MQENFALRAGGEVFSLDIPFYRTLRGNGEHPIDRTYGHGAIPRPYQPHITRRVGAQRSRFMIFGIEPLWISELAQESDSRFAAITILPPLKPLHQKRLS